MNPIIKKKLIHHYLGITLSLGKRQVPKTILKRKWKVTAITHQGIFSIL
jgi:hypothetical protein